MGAVRRGRDAGEEARVSEGPVPERAGRADEVARAARGGDRVRALPRRPADGARPPHRVEARREVRRLERALPPRPVDEGIRDRRDPEGVVPAGVRDRRSPAVGRARRFDHQAVPPDRAHQGEAGVAHGRLQVGALLRLRGAGQRGGHGAGEGDGAVETPLTPTRRSERGRPPDPSAPGEGCAPAAYRDVAKGAAYRQKAMPDLPSASRKLPAQGQTVSSPSGDVRKERGRAAPVAPQHDGRARAGDPRGGTSGALLGRVQPSHEALDGAGFASGPGERARGLRHRGDRRVRRRRRGSRQREAAARARSPRAARALAGRAARCPRRSSPRATRSGSSPASTSTARATRSPTAGEREFRR